MKISFQKEVNRYISESLIRGENPDEIKQEMKKAGYSAKLIKHSFNRFEAKQKNRALLTIYGTFLAVLLAVFLLPNGFTGYTVLHSNITEDIGFYADQTTQETIFLDKQINITSLLFSGSVYGDVEIYAEDEKIFDSDDIIRQKNKISLGNDSFSIETTDSGDLMQLYADSDIDDACVLYEIFSYDNQELTTICLGNDSCCNFLELEPVRKDYSVFSISEGSYGTSVNNLVSATLHKIDYDLDNLKFESYESSRLSFNFSFYSNEFENYCNESCAFSKKTDALVFDVIVNSGNITIDSIKLEKTEYIAEEETLRLQDIENITLTKDSNISINLNGYVNKQRVNFSVFPVSGINLTIQDNVLYVFPDDNFTGNRYSYITANYSGYSSISNLFTINVEEPKEITINETIEKPKVIIGKPVKWTKKISLNEPSNFSINISKEASNISIKRVVNNISLAIDESNVKVRQDGEIKNLHEYEVDKQAEKINKKIDELRQERSKDILNITKIRQLNEEITALKNHRNQITGYSVFDVGNGPIADFFRWFSGMTGFVVLEKQEQNESLELIINESLEDVEVEYYTEGPVSDEENTIDGKKIVISSDVHYEDILAYTYLPAEQRSKDINLYWLINDSSVEVNTTDYDLNDNGLVDYIEWTVPHLSNQTYKLVIKISRAELLDENRSFVADVFDYVDERDQNFTSVEPGYYIRVTFEQSLDNTRDITIYARSNMSNSSVEVYGQDNDSLIADFGLITNDTKYRVLLVALPDNYSQDVFDLKIKGGIVEFDHIIDPIAYNETNVTQCGEINASGYYTLINSSIVDFPDTCINITAENVTFDCNGYTIDGADVSWSAGIQIFGPGKPHLNNVTVKNCSIQDFTYGVYLYNVSNSTIQNITFQSMDTSAWPVANGIYFRNSNHNKIYNFTMSNSTGGTQAIFFRESTFNNISSGKIDGISYAIYVNNYNYNNTFSKLNLSNNTNGLFIGQASDSNNLFYDIYFNNSADIIEGKASTNYWSVDLDCSAGPNIIGGNCIGGNYWPDYEWYDNTSDGIGDYPHDVLPGELDYFPLVDSANNESLVDDIYNVTKCRSLWKQGYYYLTNTSIVDFNNTCIHILSSNITFDCRGLTIEGGYGPNSYGVIAESTDNSPIFNITVKSCNIKEFDANYVFKRLKNSTFYNITSAYSLDEGIFIQFGQNNNLYNFTIYNQSRDYAALILYSFNAYNNITNGTIFDNALGIVMHNGNENNTFSRLKIIDNDKGISFTYDNTDSNIFFNNLINNTINLESVAGTVNFWNITNTTGERVYSSGNYYAGNFWANTTGKGYSEYCTDANEDGYCDSSYDILGTGDNVDYWVLSDDFSNAPSINFTYPTPDDGSNFSSDAVYVNVSTSDANDHSAFIDWNKSLEGWWNFDDYNGTNAGDIIYDNSTYGRNGIIAGNVSYTANGKRGGAFTFDGDNDWVTVANGTNLSNVCINGCTMAAWYNPNEVAIQGIIARASTIDDDIFFSLQLANNHRPTFQISGNGNLTTCQAQSILGDNYTLNQWNFVVGVYNTTHVILYGDSDLTNPGSAACSFASLNETAWQDPEPTYIGQSLISSSYDFNGSIDEVMIFRRVLSPEEIKALYDAGSFNLYNNFTDLDDGDYTYQAYAIDANGNINSTEIRQVTISASAANDTIFGKINFTPPTWPNNYHTSQTTNFFNVTVIEQNLKNFIWSWNGTNFSIYSPNAVMMLNLNNNSVIGESGNIVVDISGNKNNATIFGASREKIGRHGSALSFDGLDDYLYVNDTQSINHTNLSVGLTLGFWFKPTIEYNSSSGYISLIHHENYEVSIVNGPLLFRVNQTNITTEKNVWEKNKWYRILATYDGVNQRIYVNGTSDNKTQSKFYVKNSADEFVASFNNEGDLVLLGSCTVGSCDAPSDDSFVVKDGADTVAYINQTGNLCLQDGSCEDYKDSCDDYSDGSFIVRNVGTNVAYINVSGKLCLTGQLIQGGVP